MLEEGGSAEIPGKTQLNSDSKLEEELREFLLLKDCSFSFSLFYAQLNLLARRGLHIGIIDNTPNKPTRCFPSPGTCPTKLSLALGCPCIQHYFQKPNPHVPAPAQVHTGPFVHSNATAAS